MGNLLFQKNVHLVDQIIVLINESFTRGINQNCVQIKKHFVAEKISVRK